ncbi:MAG: hypothetical protein ACRDQA_14955, partial [Nocardioidaceae bacterium]
MAAWDTVARALLGACFHNSIRADRPTDEAAQSRSADELSNMAIAYLLSPDHRRAAQSPVEARGRVPKIANA